MKTKMNLATIVTSLIITSCAVATKPSRYHDETYIVKIRYSCPKEYIMAQDANGSTFCVINNAKRFNSLSVSSGSNDSILHDTGRVIRARRGKLKKQTTGKSLTGKNIKKCKN